jgi:hypothetical protein
VAVHAAAAEPVCGDVNASSSITASDALLVLKKSVSQPITLNCSAYDDQFSACQTSLAGVNADLSTCNSNLTTCQNALVCGNGVADGDEQCDGSDLDGQTCQGLGYTLGGTLACDAGCGFNTSGCATEHLPATGQTKTYGAGDDGDIKAGAVLTYADNGDGTITDKNTGLMWEKKTEAAGGYNQCTAETATCANPHNADNAYTWSATLPNYDGAAVTIFLNQLNNRCNKDTTVPCTVDADCSVPTGACGFAGHRDWRLPNRKELEGILDLSTFSPALNVAFKGASCAPACTNVADPTCSCDAGSNYWSATTLAYFTLSAWFVNTLDGGVYNGSKTDALHVRAVRSGS